MHSTSDMRRVPTGLPPPSSHSLLTEASTPIPSSQPLPTIPLHDNSSILHLQQGAEHPPGALVPLWLQQKPPARGAKGSGSKESRCKPEIIFLEGLGAVDSPGTHEDSGIHLRQGYAAPLPKPPAPHPYCSLRPPGPAPARVLLLCPGQGSERRASPAL